MICTKCGKEFEDELKVCPECGAEVEETVTEDTVEEITEETAPEEVPAEKIKEAPETEDVAEKIAEEAVPEETPEEVPAAETQREGASGKAKAILDKVLPFVKKYKAYIGIGVVALILIICIASCASGCDGKSEYDRFNYTKDYYDAVDGETLVGMLDGKEISVDLGISTISRSADMSLTVIQDAEKTLYLVKDGKLVKVADEVEQFRISAYGDSIAYVTGVENKLGDLYLYTVSKDKAKKIDSEVYYNSAVLSPNGKTVAYISDCEEVETGIFSKETVGSIYVSVNGKDSEKFYANSKPIAVTNDGKHVYYVKESEKLYVDDERISSSFEGYFFFNKNNTEIIYVEDGDTEYYTLSAKESIKIKKEVLNGIVLPEGVLTYERRVNGYYTYNYGVDTFDKCLMSFGGGLYYVYDKGENLDRVTSVYNDIVLAEDGNSLVYTNYDGDIYRVANLAESTDTEEIAEEVGALRLYASKDLKKIYFITTEDRLCFLKGDEDVRIADDVEGAIYSDKNGVIYFLSDEELFYATTSSKTKEEVEGEKVTGMAAFGNTIIFRHTDEDAEEKTWNKITKKAKFETIYTEELETEE